MMRKITSLLLVCVLLGVCFTSCSNTGNYNVTNSQEGTTPEMITPEATTPEATTPEMTTPIITTPEITTTAKLQMPPEDYEGAVLDIRVNVGKVERFKSDRHYDMNKEDISIILIIGQSNFTPQAGYMFEWRHKNQGLINEITAEPTLPELGVAYSVKVGQSPLTYLDARKDVRVLSHPSRQGNTLGGVTPSFAKRWNELTGTKVVLVQAAIEATGIDEWVKDPASYNCHSHTFGEGKCYSDAVALFKGTYEALAKDYNIVYSGYIWNQGEKDEINNIGCPISSDEAYYDAYKSMHEDLMNDLDLDFGGISIVRANQAGDTAEASNSYTKARAAQYKLCDDINNLYMISTMSETCTRAMMDQGNTVHYSQKIFNEMGVDCANNLYAALGLQSDPNEYDGIRVSSLKGNLVFKTNAHGDVIAGDCIIRNLPKNGRRIQVAYNTLGTNVSHTFRITMGDTDLCDCINEYVFIDWSKLSDNGVNKLYVTVNRG